MAKRISKAQLIADAAKVTRGTFEKLTAYKWIVQDRKGDSGRRPIYYYKLTDAGREVLTRYQVKKGVM